MSDTIEYVYGYGRTRHIASTREHVRRLNYHPDEVVGLCGVNATFGPTGDEDRPVCKRCEKIAAKAEAQS